MKHLGSLLVAGLFCGWLAGCMSLVANPDTVVERSADSRPIWSQDDYVNEGESEVGVSYKKLGVYRLELGIKQAQAAAIQDTPKLALSWVRARFKARAAHLWRSDGSEFEGDLGRAIDSVGQKFVPFDAVPRAVYWEQVRREAEEGPVTFYNVFVLLSLKRTDLYAGLKMVANQLLLATSNDRARALANDILQNSNE